MELSDLSRCEESLSRWSWRICNPSKLLELVSTFSSHSHEAMFAIYVTKELDLLSIDIVGKGSVSQVKADYREVLARASQIGAGGFFLVHNHPSGDPTPSEADIWYTIKMRRLSYELDLPLLDHFVVAGSQMRRVGPGILGDEPSTWTFPKKTGG
jgi:DNA repair protein RadC